MQNVGALSGEYDVLSIAQLNKIIEKKNVLIDTEYIFEKNATFVTKFKDGTAIMKPPVLGDPDKRIGTSLRVMAGDKFNLSVDATYDPLTGSESQDPVSAEEMVGSLISALSGGSVLEGGEGGPTNVGLINQLLGSQQFLQGYNQLHQQSTDPTMPKAYLAYVAFDKDMKLITEQSGMIQVAAANSGTWASLERVGDVIIGQNGFFGVFTFNEDPITKVSMDKLKVTYSKGRLLEEQHYYPHGLVARDGGAEPGGEPLSISGQGTAGRGRTTAL